MEGSAARPSTQEETGEAVLDGVEAFEAALNVACQTGRGLNYRQIVRLLINAMTVNPAHQGREQAWMDRERSMPHRRPLRRHQDGTLLLEERMLLLQNRVGDGNGIPPRSVWGTVSSGRTRSLSLDSQGNSGEETECPSLRHPQANIHGGPSSG